MESMVESTREIKGEKSHEKRYYISSLQCDAKGFAPENLAAIRHIALNLLKTNKTFKGSIKTKRLNAAMDTKYLEEVVFG